MKNALGAMVTTAILAISSPALAVAHTDVIDDQFERKVDQLIGSLQTAVGLDFLSREGFYVVAGIAVILVFALAMRLMRWAQDADELSRQRREVKARKRAEAEYEAAEARRAKRLGS